jgi:hypothetical protein
MEANDRFVPVGDAAVREIVAGVASVGGTEGLIDLVADLAGVVAKLIEHIAAEEGLAAVEVAADLFHDRSRPR